MLVKTRVQPSAIHGLGLFAAEFIPRGTPIWRFQPDFDQAFSPAQLDALPPPARAHLRAYAFVCRASGQAILGGDHSIFMNHASPPNTGAPPDSASPVTTLALRDIAAGEELTCDYFAFDAEAGRKLHAPKPD